MKVLSILLLLSTILFVGNSQSVYGVYNYLSPQIAELGVLTISTGSFVTYYSFLNSQHVSGETTTFNLKTNEIFTIIQRSDDIKNVYLNSVNVNGWTLSNNVVTLPISQYNVTSIESDQTTGPFNIFATFSLNTNANQFTVGKISPSSGFVEITDTIFGSFETSAYDFSEQLFYVIYSNYDETFVNSYFQNGTAFETGVIYVFQYDKKSPGIEPVTQPYDLIYCQKNNQLLAIASLMGDVVTAPGLFTIDDQSNGIINTNWMSGSAYRSGTNDIIGMTCDLSTNYLYTLATTNLTDQYPYGLTIDIFNYSNGPNNVKITSVSLAIRFLNIFSY